MKDFKDWANKIVEQGGVDFTGSYCKQSPDLVRAWVDYNGWEQPSTNGTGAARGFYSKTNSVHYELIPADSEPEPGDIYVIGSTKLSKHGTCGVVLEACGDDVEVIDQNFSPPLKGNGGARIRIIKIKKLGSLLGYLRHKDKQEQLIDYVSDPVNIGKAIEGSMKERLKLLDKDKPKENNMNQIDKMKELWENFSKEMGELFEEQAIPPSKSRCEPAGCGPKKPKDKPKVWKPKDGEEYWYLDDIDYYGYSLFSINNIADNARARVGNCYPNKIVAGNALEYKRAEHKIRQHARQAWLDYGEEIDWKYPDNPVCKRSVSYWHDNGKLYVFGSTRHQSPFAVYYPTEESAQEAIDELGDEYKLILGITKGNVQ